MTRAILTALVAASVLAFAPQAFAPQAMAQSNTGTNVKGSKANTAAQPGGSAPAQATTVQGSHSNSSSYKEGQPDKPKGCPANQKMTANGCK